MIRTVEASSLMLLSESLKFAAETFAAHGKVEHGRCAKHYHKMLVCEGQVSPEIRHWAKQLSARAMRLGEVK